jgi:hypothetical protein
MAGGIFLLDSEGGLTEMAETAFAAEVDLQKLLAQHPGLIPGDQIDPESPRRWLLVAREVSVPDDTGSRWALDHLFLDQEGVPTLVEVKRSSDPRTRREVVGQLLDYAAHSVLYWTEETIRTRFEERSRQDGHDPDADLLQFLGDDVAPGDFWQRVKTNLQAGRIRLIFVADAIPSELRRVVEFLNQQMDPVEVLAVEIRQYVGGAMKTLVPRVMGQTARKTSGGRTTGEWDEASFLAKLATRRGEVEAEVARRILRWSDQKGCGSGGEKAFSGAPSFSWWISGAMCTGRSPSGPTAASKFSSRGCGRSGPSTWSRSGRSFETSSMQSRGSRSPRGASRGNLACLSRCSRRLGLWSSFSRC